MHLSRKKRQLIIVLIDVSILTVAVYLALLIRSLEIPSKSFFIRHYIAFFPVIGVWIMSQYVAGMYSLEMPFTGYKTVGNIFFVAAISMGFGFMLYYLYDSPEILLKTMLAIFSVIAFLLIWFWLCLFYNITLRFFSKINISIIGINKAVHELLQNMDKFSYMSYEIPFVFDDNYPNDHYENIPVIKDENMYMQMIKDSNIKVVVLAYEKNVSRFLKEMLFDLMRRNIFFLDISDFFEIFLRRIPLDAVNEVWFLKNIDLSIKKIYRYGKRLVDCVMAVFLLLITLPFLPFTMLFIKLESPGPVFFLQKRVGYLGKIFTLIKFRTMCIKNNDFEPTSQNDSRIKSFGKLLRKTRIDEIPQIINVLKGEMSFIGPRPERPELVKELEQVVPFYRQRLLVKPGVSGWDQVSGEYHSPSKEDTYKKLQYDLYYIKNMSLFLDISIFFKTMSIVFNRKGI